MYYILDNALNVAGVLSLESTATPFYNDLITRKIADNSQKIWSDTLDINVPYDSPESELIAIGNHILAPSSDSSKWFCYRIYNVEEELISEGIHTKKAECYNLAIWDFYHTQIEAKKFTSSLSSDIFQYLLQNTSWTLDNLSDYFDTPKSLEISEGTTQAAIDNVIQTLECEVEAYVEVIDGHIKRKMISFQEKLGDSEEKNKVRFEYRKNMIGAKRTVSDLELYTKLYVYGGNDSKGNRVTISSVNNGSPYLINEEANDLYNNGGKYLEGAVTRESILNPSGLLTWGKKQLEFYSRPHYEYEVDVSIVDEDLELGDYVTVIDTDMSPELYLEARVIEVQQCQSDVSQNKIVIGDFIEVPVETPSTVWKLEALASQALEKANAAESWKVELFAPQGIDFGNVNEKKQVIARVYEGMTNITSKIEKAAFVWHFTDSNGEHSSELEAKYNGLGNIIELESDVAGYTVTCNVLEVTADVPLFFAYESDHRFFSHLYNDKYSTSNDPLYNVKVVQYACYEPIADKIYWSQIYEGSGLTSSEIAAGESYSITRTEKDGTILDMMICKNGGHGSHFSVYNDGTDTWIFCHFKDIANNTGYLTRFKYQPNKTITINDVTKLHETNARFSVDTRNNYYMLVSGTEGNVRYDIRKVDDIMNPTTMQQKHILLSGDFGFHEGNVYQSSCLDYPFLYTTFGGTAGTVENGDTPKLLCIDVRSKSIVYEIDYDFTSIETPTGDNHHESEGISYWYDENETRWLLKGFAFTGENSSLARRENNLYFFKETFRNEPTYKDITEEL